MIISFRTPTILERFKELWPPYRKKVKMDIDAALKYLVRHPETPCCIAGEYISNGYRGGGLHKSLLDVDMD